MAFGFAVLPGDTIRSAGVDPSPVRKARGGDTLVIDGNRDYYAVLFKHQFHVDTLGEGSCAQCHHLNRPGDRNSGCGECHTDMYRTTDAFGHDWHASMNGGNLTCTKCHEQGKERSAVTAVACDQCHKDLEVPQARVSFTSYQAPGYVNALHQMCTGCHKAMAKEVNRPMLAVCTTCHLQDMNRTVQVPEAVARQIQPQGRVIMPKETR